MRSSGLPLKTPPVSTALTLYPAQNKEKENDHDCRLAEHYITASRQLDRISSEAC